ncbi:flagellar basal body P-ring protein FlgI [Campylobacter sp. faydin G-24]|uniref:Flagellar P-ring protein n=1 Tax=Campylobacter anatolicus TaxID=2829105 RepID=A0ABS5HJ69_9BACT|nr:flagellar basal body P-ring protein FlgI [Campylobacter anatolicus]MBR8462747.1 flagellar basal body P-ring protein FlgI [Campylobacter anatolicus]MBR8464086.1 flagellar basal body P-ring protein FlgI [Campylobacter anatolicus]MBR8465991.1 flagellar basal body P-ring protein FlgI [Campylobacter anatolicus]
MVKFSSFILASFLATNAFSTQIKDLANVVGVRENQLIGYGLVVGLNGTGDGSTSEFTLQSLSNMLQTVNVKINPDDIKSKNTAAVIVTATLPPFARHGDKLDVIISSIGDAKSLQGGTLLMTPLKGVDGDIYALAQGSMSIGGKSAGRANAGGNHVTAGTIFNGALVEREVIYDIYNQKSINLSLKNTNFKTAIDIENAINANIGDEIAKAIDPRTIVLNIPQDANIIELVSSVLNLDIDYEMEQKIIIDERTGTIVSGIDAVIDPVVLTHGNITIKIEPNTYDDIADGDIDLQGDIAITPGANLLKVSGEKTTVANITRALNRLGATPTDIISILENLKRVGAIHVPLEII